jgi:subtilase family serine protease
MIVRSQHSWKALRLAGSLASVALIVILAGCNPASKASSIIKKVGSTLVSLSGQQAPAQSHSQDLGAASAGQQLNLSIALPLQNQLALHALLVNLYDPNSPFYHQFITPADFASQFAPSTKTIQEVKDYLTASGMSVTSMSPNDQFINFTSSVANIQTAFHVQVHQYSYKGKTYYGLASDPKLQSSLASSVQSITINNSNVYSSGLIRPRAPSSGLEGQQLEQTYGASSLISQGINGTGESIALFELSDYQSSDIQQYEQQNGIPGGTFQTVQVDGGAQVDQGTAEVELDMENVFAMAPKATELVYEGPNSTQGINDVYSQIVQDDKAKIVSISWGLCEPSVGSSELQALDQIFQQGASEGISFFAAAGDSGAYDCGDSNLNVDSPADDPYVTGVGGTSLAGGSETVWSCASCASQAQTQCGAGGGGGISQVFNLPSFQSGLNPSQSGASDSPCGGSGGSGGSASMRFVPDVSADADPQSGYEIYCTAQAASCPSSGNLTVGGTSGAAPVWAGAAALINEDLQKQSKDNGDMGDANPAIYAAAKSTPSAFHDITQGDNLYYQAGTGYDLASGWGSPDVATLAQAIASGPATTPPPTTGTPTPTPGGTVTPSPTSGTGGGSPPNGQNLIANGGFENGVNPWVESSAAGYELVDTLNPHSGQYDADLCGYNNCDDIIGQAFVVPSGATTLTLTYYWNLLTDTSGVCSDHFTVYIAPVQSDGTVGNPLTTVQDSCNQDANSGFVAKTVDVTSALQGQAGNTLALIFEATSGGSSAIEAFVDDVSLTAS